MIDDAPDHIEDEEYEPSVEPKSARAWWNLIVDAEKTFDEYQAKADSIDKLYADLGKLANVTRDRQFQLFWANIQVLGPSIYARPPVPVVVPKFKDRRPLYRVASELMERCSMVAFDLSDINSVMMLLRDDLTIVGRGSPWVRYETKGESDTESERVCIEHKDRKDFLHEPARNWLEVGWVAGASYLSKREMRQRFRKTSGDVYKEAAYAVRKEDRDNGAADNRLKAKVWEIWSKTEDRVVWVSEGCEKLLDDDKPHLKLEGFFPCPRPAYATVQRRSLIPVPDMVYYKDQLEEINDLTTRIHALSDSLQVKGFYMAGGEIGEAVEAAMKLNDPGKVMVPVSNWAALGSNTGDPIIWLPIDMIATTVAGLVELRRQIIDDVYQIMGLSDIMRGSTEAAETLGAQQLKSQYGSVRIRDKQGELVRVARDLVRIAAEIMAENFSKKTLLEMSQMEIPTDADIKRQVEEATAQAEQQFQQQLEQGQQQAISNPETAQQIQADPEAAQQQAAQMAQQLQQQIMGQLQPHIEKLEATPTVEAVMQFLKDNKIRSFVLDIETDSTIQPDEQAEKQSRMELMGVLAQVIAQFAPLLQMSPAMAPMFGELVKFAMAPYRVGRQLEGVIDDAIEQAVQQAQQPQPNPEAEAMKADQEIKKAELQQRQQEAQMRGQIEMQKAQMDAQSKLAEMQGRQQENDAKLAQIQAQMERDAQKGTLEMQKLQMEIEAKKQELAIRREEAQIDAAVTQQQAQIQQNAAAQQATQSERSFEQQSALAAQKAAQPAGGA